MDRTIPTLFRGAVDRDPDGTWLVTDDERLTFAEAQAVIEGMAAGLRGAGVGRGDAVVVTARSEPRYLLTWLALMEVGAVQVPVNPASTGAELAGLLGQVAPRHVVTDQGLEATAGAAAEEAGLDLRVVGADDLRSTGGDGAPPAAVDPGDPAVMIPTSGTTGRSKLVVQTHRAYVMAGEGFPWWMELTADDRLMTALPLFHVNAPAYSTLGSVAVGGSLALLPRFSASDFLDAARRLGATEFNAIGAMLEILMRQPERDDDADTPLRLCYTGPSPTKERQEEIEARFGLRVVCGYGLSESPYGLIWPRGSRPFGALGAPRQHPTLGEVNEARVMEEGEDGGRRPVARGEVGELELRNPAVMLGYHEMPDETAAVLVDGWLRTGDLVTEDDDGIYTFVGRRKEVIRRRGENLSPAEVEAAIEARPEVAEAAVIAVPSELTEDEVKAYVVSAPGAAVDVEALHRHLTGELARFKVPRWYEVVDELPHTPTGRVAKHQLPTDRNDEEIDGDRLD